MGGQVDRDRIVAELRAIAGGDTSGASSGSFAFTEPDIRRVINNWIDITKTYNDSLDRAQYIVFGDGPAYDLASRAFAHKANKSTEALVQHLRRGRDYSAKQAQLALNALNDYLGVEHTSVDQFLKAQQQDPGTEV